MRYESREYQFFWQAMSCGCHLARKLHSPTPLVFYPEVVGPRWISKTYHLCNATDLLAYVQSVSSPESKSGFCYLLRTEKKRRIGPFRLRNARSRIPLTFLLDTQVSKATLDSTSTSCVDLIMKYRACKIQVSHHCILTLGER